MKEAADKFAEIDLGNYDAALRKIIGQMRYALSVEHQEQITGAFWKSARAYFPFIGYDSSHNPRWSSRKKVLSSLAVPPTHRVLVPVSLENFRDFFDALADEMRAYLKSLEEQ